MVKEDAPFWLHPSPGGEVLVPLQNISSRDKQQIGFLYELFP
jgi:hypothetical protein